MKNGCRRPRDCRPTTLHLVAAIGPHCAPKEGAPVERVREEGIAEFPGENDLDSAKGGRLCCKQDQIAWLPGAPLGTMNT